MSSTNKPKKKLSEIKISPNLKKQNLFEVVCSYGVTILCLLFFGYIAIISILQTSTIDPANFAGEVILYEDDDLTLNFFLIGAFFLIIFALRKFANAFLKVSDKVLMAGLALYTVTLGFIWIFMVKSIPAADSGSVADAAAKIANGDWSPFVTSNNDFYGNISYFQFYPFQLGFVFLSEIVYRIFGTDTTMSMQVINVLALAAMYVGLLKISKQLFHSKAVTFITTFMLAGCIQPIFFTTFVYGNIIGFSAAIWACYFVIKFMQSQKEKNYLLLIPASLFMALSIIAKYNNMIWLVAICIGLLIYSIRSKKWLSLLSILFICLISIGSFNLIIFSYEKRSGVEFGDGMGQPLYFDVGISESSMAPGWFNYSVIGTYINTNCSTEESNKIAMEDIKLRMEKFKSDPKYTRDFFNKKIISQWNEPSYECLWISQVKGHYNGEVKADSLLYSIYSGKWNKFFYDYFGFFQMISFILFAVAMIALIKKRCNAETMLMLIVLIGGFLYHLIFEGKSQYLFTYFILIVFFASYGLYFIIKPRTFKKKDRDSKKKSFGEYIIDAAEKIDSKTR